MDYGKLAQDTTGPLTHGFKAAVKGIIKASGYSVRRLKELPPHAPDIRHADVLPLATYSPWLADPEFNRVYDLIKDHTLVDQYRCYELWQLAAEAGKLAAGDVIEVGVWRGGTSALIGSRFQSLCIPATLYLCDTFRGVVKASNHDATYVGGEHADTAKSVVTGLCDRLQLDRVRILEGVFPDETGQAVRDNHFRFCHIDVDTYQSAKDITDWIWPHLVPGGIIVYDDYGFYSCVGVTEFVNEERLKTGRIVIHNLNGHAIVFRIPEDR